MGALNNYNEMLTATGGSDQVAVTQASIAAGNVVVKAAPGRLCKVLVTSAATAGAAVTIYDNASAASGTIIGYIPIGATGVIDFSMPAYKGIFIAQSASLSTGNFTISFI